MVNGRAAGRRVCGWRALGATGGLGSQVSARAQQAVGKRGQFWREHHDLDCMR